MLNEKRCEHEWYGSMALYVTSCGKKVKTAM
ncbi:hypothetical protein MTYM_01337 [Methylococcales bacterium]|nr:hypothetical protein MTYM_01337 [Methylococcales bacterium]